MSKLKFDEPDEARAPAGPPSVPISGDNTGLPAGPSVPISTSNLDTRGLKFDAPSEEQKSAQRVREIAAKMKAGSPYTPGPLDYIADAASLSTSRPISAAAGAATGGLLGSYPGSSFEERYKAGVQFMNDRARLAEQMTGPAAPIVGGLAQIPATMTGAGNITRPASTLKVATQAAIPGAIEGASQNAGSIASALEGGAKNAALSGLVAGGLDVGMKSTLPAARRGAAAEATAARGASPDDIKADAKILYQQLDNAGIAYSPQQTAPLYVALHNMRNSGQFSPAANPGLVDHFDSLMQLTRQGATFNQLHDLRSVIAEQARGPDPSTRRAAGQILGEMDRLVTRTPPAINPGNVDVSTVYPEASRLWRAASLADDAGWIADKTERKMAVQSGADPDATTRKNFAAVEQRITKPGAYDPYTDEQRQLLSRIIRGGPVQNMEASTGAALRGRYAPWAGGAAGLTIPTILGLSKNVDPILTTAAAGAAGATTAGAVNQLGKAFQGAAASRGTENVNALLRNITGSPPPTPGAAITRGDLAKILFAQDLARLAPRVGSQIIGTRQEEQP